MLVLSRKEGERLTIGNDITLVVSKISGNRVTLGVEAPKNVKIVRTELVIDLQDAVVPAVSEDSSAGESSLKVFRSKSADRLRKVS